MPTVLMVEGDNFPALIYNLKDVNGVAIDLTGATCRFRIREYGKTTELINRIMTITDAVNGQCKHDWNALADWVADRLVPPRIYEGEVNVSFPGGIDFATTFEITIIRTRSKA